MASGAEVKIDLIELITKASTGKILDSLEPGMQQGIFRDAIVAHIKDKTDLLHYDVRRAIEEQITILALERLQDPPVQAAMREAAYEAVDKVIEALAHEAAGSLSRGLQATYSNIVEKYNKAKA